MDTNRELDVFVPYQPLFHILTIYDSRHYHDVDRRSLHTFYAAFFSTLILGFVVLIFGDALYCISYKFDLSVISLPFGVLISAVQMSITYIAIAMKSEQLEKAIARLRKLIHKRK